MTTMTKEQEYDASSITVLEGLQAVRERPGCISAIRIAMGLHQLVYEVVITVSMKRWPDIARKLRSLCIRIIPCLFEDNGRGIPVGRHEKESVKQGRDVSALEVVMTILHAGGKFDKNTYKVSGGLHGVGVSCVNALSKKMIVEVCQNGKIYEMEFSQG